MKYIVIGLIILVLILIYIILIQRKLSNKIYKENKVMAQAEIKYQDIITLKEKAIDNIKTNYTQSELKLKELLILFAKSPIKVYTQGNFYSNYSFYNGRFYAKVNNKDTNNKAEGIPVIQLPDNKNAVIDLYLLSNLYKTDPLLDINIMIKHSTRLKEDIIKELGNKILKSYKR